MDDATRQEIVSTVVRALTHHKGTEEAARMVRQQFELPAHKAEEAVTAVRDGMKKAESCIFRGLSPAEELEKINSKLGRLAFQAAMDLRERRQRRMKVLVAIVGVLIIVLVFAVNYHWLAPLLGLVEKK